MSSLVPRVPWAWALLLCCAVALQLSSCRCSGSDVIARVVDHSGTIQRDYASRQGEWESATVGAEFRMGDAVRSQEESGANLALGTRARLTLGERSLVRFLARSRSDQTGIDVEVGEAVLETASQTFRIDSVVGAVVLEPNTRLFLSKSKRGVRLEVKLGKVHFESRRLPTPSAVKGQGLEVSVGGVLLEQYQVDAAHPVPSARPGLDSDPSGTVPDPSAAPDRDRADQNGPSLIFAHVRGPGASRRLERGEVVPLPEGRNSIEANTVLKVDASTRVRVERGNEWAELGSGEYVVGRPGGSLVEEVRGATRPERRTTAAGGRGARAAGAPIVPTAPLTPVDTDGRRYTVFYQSRLPTIQVAWSAAPRADYYTLHVDSRTIQTTTPYYAFSEGDLAEGTHSVVFEALTDPPRRSNATTIVVTPDHALPTASAHP
jgi:hypothetical protein